MTNIFGFNPEEARKKADEIFEKPLPINFESKPREWLKSFIESAETNLAEEKSKEQPNKAVIRGKEEDLRLAKEALNKKTQQTK